MHSERMDSVSVLILCNSTAYKFFPVNTFNLVDSFSRFIYSPWINVYCIRASILMRISFDHFLHIHTLIRMM